MNLRASLAVLATIIVLCVASISGADNRCDCTKWPFEPNPPCADICIAKYLAIASLDDLRKFFGLPDDLAKKIASIPPRYRPHSLEGYKGIIPEGAFKMLEQQIHFLVAEDFQRLRMNAATRGISLNELEW